jgi:DNA-binding transcriptional ArsR family regulator
VAQVWTGIESRSAYLRRLSVVFADELRLKIVTELYMREMSAKEFYEEFGGGSISRVHRHFKKLAEHGWLRLIRSESGGRRRGSTEHFYRATELAVFDHETWAQVPYSIRISYSWRTFKQLAERVREALQEETFDVPPQSHLSWAPLLLDEIGWDRVTVAFAELFGLLFEEQADAKLRIFHSEEESMLATVGLAVFESPTFNQSAENRLKLHLVEGADSPVPFSRRLSKVFADELCLKIVAETNLRKMSVLQFHRKFGGTSVNGVHRRFKMLEEIGWLKEVNQKTGGRRRGAVERFFRATRPAVVKGEAWADIPDSIKTTSRWRTFRQLSSRVKEAIEAGTFEARTDSHLSWSLLRLDRLAWANVASQVTALSTLMREEQDAARLRVADSGEALLSVTVALAAFESPKDPNKEP